MKDSPPPLSYLELTVAQASTQRFYCDLLGMKLCDDRILRFPGQDCGLLLRVTPEAEAYQASGQDGYWKIGISVADLDLAVSRLREQGQQVSEPQQFRNIGYLCHTKDPEGLCIELLAHQFDGKVDETKRKGSPLGSQAGLGQITLRVNDPERSLAFYTETLGMTLLSVQPVDPYRFTLYFLSDQTDTAPETDLTAVANREWLWQRPYTTLELQHLWDGGVGSAQGDGVGYQALVFGDGKKEVDDPDGHRLRV